MFTKLVAAAAILSAPVLALAVEERADAVVYAGAPISDIRVSATNVNQCSTASLTWTGASDPVTLYIAIGGFYVGEMQEVDTQTDVYGGSATWLVNQQAGQSMHFRVTDAGGKVAYVQGIVIGDGDDWCLGDKISPSASASSVAAGSDAGSSTWAEHTSTDVGAQTAASSAVTSATTTSSDKSRGAQKSDEARWSSSTSSTKKAKSSNSSSGADQATGGAAGVDSATSTASASSNNASPISSSTSTSTTATSSSSSASTSADPISAVGANAPAASNGAIERSTKLWGAVSGVLLAMAALY